MDDAPCACIHVYMTQQWHTYDGVDVGVVAGVAAVAVDVVDIMMLLW